MSMIVCICKLLFGQSLSKIHNRIMQFPTTILTVPPRIMISFLPRLINLPISPQSPKIPKILPLTWQTMLQVPVTMQLRYFLDQYSRSHMQPIRILRDQMFEYSFFNCSRNKHMGKRWIGEIYYSVDRRFWILLLFMQLLMISVPQSGPRFYNGILRRSIIRDTKRGGDTCPCKNDGVLWFLDYFSTFILLLLWKSFLFPLVKKFEHPIKNA